MEIESNKIDYQRFFELSSLSIALLSSEKTFISINNNFLKTFETTKNDVLEKSIDVFFDLTKVQLERIETLTTEDTPFKSELLGKHKNGDLSPLYTIIQKVELSSGAGTGYLVEILGDTSELTSAITTHPRLSPSQRTGKVISQISHDISNPLAIIKIHCDSFSMIAKKEESIPSSDVLKRMEKLNKAANRVNETTSELKHFAKSLINSDHDEVEKIWLKTEAKNTPPKDGD